MSTSGRTRASWACAASPVSLATLHSASTIVPDEADIQTVYMLLQLRLYDAVVLRRKA